MQRTGLTVSDGDAEHVVPMAGRWFKPGSLDRPTVGDWVVLDDQRQSIEALVRRTNLLQRRQPDGQQPQPIAANVDALLVITACNQEFNPSRLERYLLLAREAGVRPVVVLTKMDEAPAPETFIEQARIVAGDAPVYAVDARDGASVAALKDVCGAGRTLVLLGSSGVGKSTLLNSLAGGERQRTGAARDSDNKGRHTTSHRSLHVLADGTLIIDSPGIRELGLLESEAPAEIAFDDIDALRESCRFRDCRHGDEPGCAVRAAIAEGRLELRRFESFQKLSMERAGKPRPPVTRSVMRKPVPRGAASRKGKLADHPDE